jgi:alcohol dehydrogenase (cytochrome c)
MRALYRTADALVAVILFAALAVLPTFAIATPDTPAQPETTAATQRTPDAEWPMYNGTYDGQRYSHLDRIDADNVGGLKEVCRVRVGDAGGFSGSPVVVDGVMYVTFRNSTLALNPVDCGVIWKTLYVPEQREPIPAANRGVAVLDGRLFRGTGDGRLLALEAATGREVWRVVPADPTAGEWLSAAPVAWDHKIYIGVAGSDFGIRGRMLAFEPEHGGLLWRFNLIPQPPEFGSSTWQGDTWRTGGGGTWSTVTIDPLTGEIFVPVGNPAPDLILPTRITKDNPLGQDLFTSAVVALDARSGRLRWYYQATAHDERDFDQAAAPMLFEMSNGRRALAAASKDGYLRVIDRTTHQLIYKLPTTTIRNEDKLLTARPLEVCPGVLGGTEWNGPAYDAREKTVVVGAVDWCSLLQRDGAPRYERGAIYFGGHYSSVMGPPPSGWITSVEADTGKLRWKFHAPAPVIGAITPTAGGITFAGDQLGNFYALRSADGKVLYRAVTPGAIAGGIVTYTVAQRQYVAITSGNIARAVWGATGLPYIVIYSVDGATNAEAPANIADVNAARGEGAYQRVCASCHGSRGEGLSGPPLTGIGTKLSADRIASQIRQPRRQPGGATAAMPPIDEFILSDQEVADVAAYLATL